MDLPEEVKLFLVESNENLDKAEQDLLSLERNPTKVDLVNPVFRTIHTIKGNSGFLGFQQLELLCHKGEAVLDALRSNKLQLSAAVVSIVLKVIDTIRDYLVHIESSGKENSDANTQLLSELDSLIVNKS